MSLASHLLLTSIPLLITMYTTRYRELDRLEAFPDNPSNFNLPALEVFDFIIVGGGTAGCIVARRLADANFKVLLLEAGGTPPPIQNVPIATADSIEEFHPAIHYLYKSVPQKNLGLSNNGIIKTETGKMLGGGSSHNTMIYQRGSPIDYDGWAEVTGDDTWRYSNLVKYFRASENYMGNFSSKYNDQHGVGGPVTITSPYFPQRDVWLKAARELSFEVKDLNGPQTVGFSPSENFNDRGRRVSTYTAYVESMKKSRKRNLDVRRYSPVSKVLFEGNVARGVLYRRHEIPKVAAATKEVIICAGAYVSPILLMKSGIGSKADLDAANVKPVVVSPQVGKNLMDHLQVRINFDVKDLSATWSMAENLTFSDFDGFLDQGKGHVGFAGPGGLAYLTSRRAKRENPKWPDLQVNYFFQTKDRNYVGCVAVLERPYSRGTITFNTSVTDMEDDNLPIIDQRYLSENSDLDVILDGIDFCFQVIEGTKAFKSIGAQYTEQPIEPCRGQKFLSKDYWACYVQHRGNTNYHTSGTCKMGKADDINGSVVDSKLRVHGVKNLRVIDASIMPLVTNANTAAPVMVIAEKTVASIIDEYKSLRRPTNRPPRTQRPATTKTARPGFPFIFPGINFSVDILGT